MPQQCRLFCNFVQQAVNSFPEFLTHVTNAVEKHVSFGPTKHIPIKQLIWEGLNTITYNAIIPVRNEDIHKWILATHDISTEWAHFCPYDFHQCLA